MKKFVTGMVVCVCTLVTGWYLFQQALVDPSYTGLPTVACQDTTRPIVNSFKFSLQITINGKKIAVPLQLGHDYGNCLHDIFVNDASGTVYVRSNDAVEFTLGQFFDVWHMAFSPTQLFGYTTKKGHSIKVFVNGKEVQTYRNTLLTPGEDIQVIYQ